MSFTHVAPPSKIPEVSEGSQRCVEVSLPDVRGIGDESEDCHLQKLPITAKVQEVYEVLPGHCFSSVAFSSKCHEKVPHPQPVLASESLFPEGMMEGPRQITFYFHSYHSMLEILG